MQWFKDWFGKEGKARRKGARDHKRYVSGYDFALGRLARGEGSVEELRSHAECARDFGDATHFDIGMEDACDWWVRHRPVA